MTTAKRTFQTIVIGAGLMGSAATRYLSAWGDGVAVIGPAEPQDEASHTGVFASHYDQARLTVRLTKDVTWSRIARHAMDKYRELEAASGVSFYRPVGRLLVESPQSPTREWDTALDVAAAEGIDYQVYAAGDDGWRARFPDLDFPAGFDVLYEPDPAGYVNPRGMLQAQLTIGAQQGATVIRETVVDVQADAAGVTVTTDAGATYRADKVLVAAGAFTNFNNLLPHPIPLKLKTEDIILGQVSPADAARLADMPVVNYQIIDADIDDIYMTPPLQFPDGNYYVKLGCNTRTELWPRTLPEVQDWFRRGIGDPCEQAMADALRVILPRTDFQRMVSRRCIVTYTPSGLPTIDAVSDRVFVVTGGNGSGAKGSDTLGHLAAGLLHDGRWLDDIPRAPFQLTATPFP